MCLDLLERIGEYWSVLGHIGGILERIGAYWSLLGHKVLECSGENVTVKYGKQILEHIKQKSENVTVKYGKHI